MTDYKRLQALIPDWEGWNHRWDSFGEAYEKAWLWWLAGALMQACKEKGVPVFVDTEFGTASWEKENGSETSHEGDWPQAIIEACAEALENG